MKMESKIHERSFVKMMKMKSSSWDIQDSDWPVWTHLTNQSQSLSTQTLKLYFSDNPNLPPVLRNCYYTNLSAKKWHLFVDKIYLLTSHVATQRYTHLALKTSKNFVKPVSTVQWQQYQRIFLTFAHVIILTCSSWMLIDCPLQGLSVFECLELMGPNGHIGEIYWIYWNLSAKMSLSFSCVCQANWSELLSQTLKSVE